jgi:hypothetical protein
LSLEFFIGNNVFVHLLFFLFILMEDGGWSRDEFVMLILAFFEEIPEVKKVENFLELKVLAHDRVLDPPLQLISKV